MHESTRRKTRTGSPLEGVRLTESERLAAQASLEQGERIADAILRVAAALASFFHGIERGLRALTRA